MESIKEFLNKFDDAPHRAVYELGSYWDVTTDVLDVVDTQPDERIGETTIRVDSRLSQAHREQCQDVLRIHTPIFKSCFYNALSVWNIDNEFSYVEGYVKPFENEELYVEHAWNLLDDCIVDYTSHPDWGDEYYGVEISNDSELRKYYEQCLDTGVWGIIGNYGTRFEWLRDKGYL